MENIIKELKEAGFETGIAFATPSETENGAACGQLAIINEEDSE